MGSSLWVTASTKGSRPASMSREPHETRITTKGSEKMPNIYDDITNPQGAKEQGELMGQLLPRA